MGPSIIDETVLAEPHNVSGGTPTCAPRDGLGLVGSARADSSGPELGFSKKNCQRSRLSRILGWPGYNIIRRTFEY